MTRRVPPLLPRVARLLKELGANIRRARLRRRYLASVVAERASIDRRTLRRVEQGDAAVSIGVYARVLQALGLVDDLAAIARDDQLGRRIQDLGLEEPKRARRAGRTDAEPEE
jgi:transcriptional regulator with XRE-family HTH domain